MLRVRMILFLVSSSQLALAAQAKSNAANHDDRRAGSTLVLRAPETAVAGSLIRLR